MTAIRFQNISVLKYYHLHSYNAVTVA